VTTTTVNSTASAMDRAVDAGAGIVRLAPAWVPRAFCTPGRRIRLHPDDYFALGQNRGGIDERVTVRDGPEAWDIQHGRDDVSRLIPRERHPAIL